MALAAIVVVKAAAALAAPVLAGRAGRRPGALGRRARALGWIAATVLVLYGGVLTLVGVAVQLGIVDAAEDADERALAWHAFLWDPWFLAWGLAFAAALRWSRPAPF